MSRLDDVIRGLPATQQAAIRQAIRNEAKMAARPERVSYGAKYAPASGKLAGVEFRNRDEYRRYQGMVREANALVRQHGVSHGKGPGSLKDGPAKDRLSRLGHELFARVHKVDVNGDAWAWLIENWY
jgi:hypothetical protein